MTVSTKINTIINEPHPLSKTEKGGNKIAKRTLIKLIIQSKINNSIWLDLFEFSFFIIDILINKNYICFDKKYWERKKTIDN